MSGLSLKRNAVMIDIACNDPDNGLFAGRAEMIEIGTEFIELEARGRPPRFDDYAAESSGFVHLAGKRWPVIGSKYGVGNWCWNGYWMEIPVAVDFLVWLHGRRLFNLTCGEAHIYGMWKLDRSLDNPTDREFLWLMLGDPLTFHNCSHNDFPRERASA